MDIIAELKQDHRDIERELLELETIIEEEEINRGNLIHTFERLIKIWNPHEEKEELFFPVLEKSKQHIKIPVQKMLLEHKALKPHREAIKNAISSGEESEIKKSLEQNGKILILKIREHINFEDEILYTSTIVEFGEDELKELWNQMLKENGK